MSATQDKNQKFTFIYSNLYQLYKKGSSGVESGRVIKAQTVDKNAQAQRVHQRVQLKPVSLLHFISKRAVRKDERQAVVPASEHAVESLKQNLKALSDLHARLRFMLQELEELVKE